MTLLRLSQIQIEHFTEIPETAMGLHVTTSPIGRERLVFVLGGAVALVSNGAAFEEISALMQQPWLRASSDLHFGERLRAFEAWFEHLGPAPKLSDPPPRGSVLGLIIVHPSTLSAPPPRPLSIYGHLPFSGVTEPNDMFYRCEPWPTSRRINQTKQEVASGTYACPESELPFFPTGFAAVGRYALPNLLPASFRWELQPTTRSAVHCGASVPLYGQAGGGVEVCFDTLTKNRGPIANPVVLPAL
jgi:hypothetical protein